MKCLSIYPLLHITHRGRTFYYLNTHYTYINFIYIILKDIDAQINKYIGKTARLYCRIK